jgi:hypothetical protein
MGRAKPDPSHMLYGSRRRGRRRRSRGIRSHGGGERVIVAGELILKSLEFYGVGACGGELRGEALNQYERGLLDRGVACYFCGKSCEIIGHVFQPFENFNLGSLDPAQPLPIFARGEHENILANFW